MVNMMARWMVWWHKIAFSAFESFNSHSTGRGETVRVVLICLLWYNRGA